MTPLRCRALGHHFRLSVDGRTMRWRCSRCEAGGAKEYPTPEQATRYARALDAVPWHEQARRAPFLGLLPLRIARLVRQWVVKRRRGPARPVG